jgi:hypothetical protein
MSAARIVVNLRAMSCGSMGSSFRLEHAVNRNGVFVPNLDQSGHVFVLDLGQGFVNGCEIATK